MGAEQNGHANGHSSSVARFDSRPVIAMTRGDRLPRYDKQAEQAYLGSIIRDNDVLKQVQPALPVTSFYREAHQVIYQTMLDLYEQGTAIDPVTLRAELIQTGNWHDSNTAAQTGRYQNHESVELLTEIIESTPYAFNATHYAQIIRNHADARAVIDLCTETLDSAYSGHLPVGMLVSELSKKVTIIEHGNSVHAKAEELSIHPLPDKMDAAAFYGPAGKIALLLEPETEACVEAVFLHLLAMIGHAFGPLPHWDDGNGGKHRCNLFVCTVGMSGEGRKGTAYNVGRTVLSFCQGKWRERRRARNMITGEGLIHAVNEARGPVFILESEFGKTLDNCNRQFCTLGGAMKQAWDDRHLSVMTKNNPVECDNAFVAISANVTYSELREKLMKGELENGFGNRFIWGHNYRSKYLPRRGQIHLIRSALDPLLTEIDKAVTFAECEFETDETKNVPVQFTPEAEAIWDQGGLYVALSGPRMGLYGSATSRRAQMVVRIALIFAILDRVFYIAPEHLTAALAVWDYCDRTAAHIWGSPRQEGDLGKIIEFIEGEKDGVTRTDINRKLYAGRIKPEELDRLLSQAQATGHVVYRKIKTAGAPRHEWVHKKYVSIAQKAH